ncbi:MAG: hypothetical protein LBJ03_03240 [Holosporales bacterium]|nr:hypothetical protein [Holosporales bacterium]
MTSEKFFAHIMNAFGFFIVLREDYIAKRVLLIGSVALLSLGGAFDTSAMRRLDPADFRAEARGEQEYTKWR